MARLWNALRTARNTPEGGTRNQELGTCDILDHPSFPRGGVYAIRPDPTRVPWQDDDRGDGAGARQRFPRAGSGALGDVRVAPAVGGRAQRHLSRLGAPRFEA